MSDLRELIDKWADCKLDLDKNDLDHIFMKTILTYTRYQDGNYINRKLDEHNAYYKNFSTFMKRTMGWIHCNPSRPDTVQLSKETFVFPNTKDPAKLNTKQGMYRFCQILTDTVQFQNKYYAITGPKGSGKTYTQNYFLNQYSKKLFRKKTTWFRIDMTKILKYQSYYGKELTLEQYLNAQIVYVFFRYRDNEYSQDIFSELDIRILEQNVKSMYEKEKNDFNFVYKNLKNILKTGKGITGTNKPIKHPLTAYFAQEIIKMIEKEGFSFVLFVDGIDNVDYAYDKNLKRWISEISCEEENDKRTFFRAKKIILSCRPETINIIRTIQRNRKCSWNIGEINSFWIAPISVKRILDKFLVHLVEGKLDSIPAVMKEYEKLDFDRELLEKNDRQNLLDFYDFGLSFYEYIAKAINDRHYKDFSIKEDEVLSKLYHFSLRDVISDILQTYVYIHHYRIAKGYKRASVKKMIENRQITHNLIYSMALRHGYLYLRQYSDYAPPFSILHSIDILNPSSSFKNTPLKYMWLGYIFLKKVEYQPFSLEDIARECARIGLEEETYIKKARNRFLEHGLIHYMYIADTDEELKYEITDRGRFALIGLSDIDVLNISSYKSYYPNKFLKHSLAKPFEEDFSDTTTSLLGNVLSVLKLLQIGQKELKTNYIHFDIFSDKVIRQLLSITKDIKLKEFIETFSNFIDLYGDGSLDKTVMGMETLLNMYENGQISKYDYLKRLTQLTLKD